MWCGSFGGIWGELGQILTFLGVVEEFGGSGAPQVGAGHLDRVVLSPNLAPFAQDVPHAGGRR